jgi:subtilisin family serine protease
MSDEEAARLRREVANVVVLVDRPIELIRPRQANVAPANQVTTSDLWHLEAIGLEDARRQGFHGSGKNIVVAVLDTGIDDSHPELNGKVTRTCEFDRVNRQPQIVAQSYDTDGHGTHVAGLICGTNVGVAPETQLFNGLMLPKGIGYISDFIAAMEWAAQQPEVQIVNISAGISGYTYEMEQFVQDFLDVGVLVVCAIGNEGFNNTRSPGNCKDVVSVGAAKRNGKIAGFSGSGKIIVNNHGYYVPYLVAPGEQIYSAAIGRTYQALDGTSMAAAIVSGVAALILEKYPAISLLDLRDQLMQTCEPLLQDITRRGSGLVQVRAAI